MLAGLTSYIHFSVIFWLLASYSSMCKFKLCNENKIKHALTIDGYCTCSTSHISCRTNGPWCCIQSLGFPLYWASIILCVTIIMCIHQLAFVNLVHKSNCNRLQFTEVVFLPNFLQSQTFLLYGIDLMHN